MFKTKTIAFLIIAVSTALLIGIITTGILTANSDKHYISVTPNAYYDSGTGTESTLTAESTSSRTVTTATSPMVTVSATNIAAPATTVIPQDVSKDEPAYSIRTDIYKSNKISFPYPQLENFNNSDKINQLIYNDIVPDILVDYKEYSETIDFELNYEIKLMNGEILSIVYTGLAYNSKWAYPHNLFYATSINLQTGTKIKLPDIINLNNEFADIFKSVASENELTISEAYKVIGENSNEELLRIFNGDYPYSDSIIYFTEDFLGISIGVPHACGDHLECEIKYNSIADFFINNFSIN